MLCIFSSLSLVFPYFWLACFFIMPSAILRNKQAEIYRCLCRLSSYFLLCFASVGLKKLSCTRYLLNVYFYYSLKMMRTEDGTTKPYREVEKKRLSGSCLSTIVVRIDVSTYYYLSFVATSRGSRFLYCTVLLPSKTYFLIKKFIVYVFAQLSKKYCYMCNS